MMYRYGRRDEKVVKGKNDYIFNFIINFLGFIIICSVLFVLLFIISASFSDPREVVLGNVFLFPKGFNLDAYKTLIEKADLWMGYKNSIIYTIVGTLINVSLTMLTAYPLSRRDFKGKGIITIFFMFTMYFSGGLVPTFILVKSLGMYNSMWSLLLPGAVSTYNIIICRTFLQTSIPYEIQESAKIDGFNDFGIFFKIILPLSGPIIAVLVMFYALGHWNNYFSALIYLTDRKKYPLQIFLSEILVRSQQVGIEQMMSDEDLLAAQKQADQAELLKYALVIVSSLPFMILYLMLQKYFVKGIMVGAIKG